MNRLTPVQQLRQAYRNFYLHLYDDHYEQQLNDALTAAFHAGLTRETADLIQDQAYDQHCLDNPPPPGYVYPA